MTLKSYRSFNDVRFQGSAASSKKWAGWRERRRRCNKAGSSNDSQHDDAFEVVYCSGCFEEYRMRSESERSSRMLKTH